MVTERLTNGIDTSILHVQEDLSGLPPDSEAQQAAVLALSQSDALNWGYDPVHYSAPEGAPRSPASLSVVKCAPAVRHGPAVNRGPMLFMHRLHWRAAVQVGLVPSAGCRLRRLAATRRQFHEVQSLGRTSPVESLILLVSAAQAATRSRWTARGGPSSSGRWWWASTAAACVWCWTSCTTTPSVQALAMRPAPRSPAAKSLKSSLN